MFFFTERYTYLYTVIKKVNDLHIKINTKSVSRETFAQLRTMKRVLKLVNETIYRV